MNEKIKKATEQMIVWADDPAHGYDQADRWGPDYDCSSAVIQAWELAGVPVKSRGATYTGNMYKAFGGCGFEDVTLDINLASGHGLQYGDVLLNHIKHTAMYIGDGRIVEASINEYGTITGGTPGDQTGLEFRTSPYRNHPWDCVLRYTGKYVSDSDVSGTMTGLGTAPKHYYNIRLPLLKMGIVDDAVETLQILLEAEGYYDGDIDGFFGFGTEQAVKELQKDNGKTVDGEVGGETWPLVLKG